jgi:pyridoxine kinase
MSKNIILINDMPGCGSIALAAMVPILRHFGHRTFSLPTAIVSNELDYGKFTILDTTDYMKKCIQVWQQLGFSYDAVATGFIAGPGQTDFIAEFCRAESDRGAKIFVDPIMADNGRLYNGIGGETVTAMKKIVAAADYTVPNYTEAAFLTGTPCRAEPLSRAEADRLVDGVRALGAKTVVITSAFVEGQHAVVGYDHEKDQRFLLPFELLPISLPGTGDIFSAVLAGRVLSGWDVRSAVQSAMDAVAAMITRTTAIDDRNQGIAVESCLDLLDQKV